MKIRDEVRLFLDKRIVKVIEHVFVSLFNVRLRVKTLLNVFESY